MNYSLNMDIQNQTEINHILKIIFAVYIYKYTTKPQIIYGLDLNKLRQCMINDKLEYVEPRYKSKWTRYCWHINRSWTK